MISMKKNFCNKKSILMLTAIIVLSVCLFSCITNHKTIATNNHELITRFDGKYNITFISQDYFRAITDFEIENSILDGVVVNTSNQTFFIKGSVSESGQLNFKSLKSNTGANISAIGNIKLDGSIEGHYTVGNRQGKYYGFKYSDSKTITTQFDGKYQISFYIGDQQTASTEIDLKNGAFKKNIQTITSEIFPIQGRVLDPGKLILTTSIGDHSTGIAASGSIDENKKVTGIFFTNQGEKGSFNGKRIDQ